MKILSLDFWGTIAVFNPDYSKARTKLLAEYIELPEDEAHAKYQFIKRKLDRDAEHLGTAVTPLVACKMLLKEAGREDLTAYDLQLQIETAVRDNPPLLDHAAASMIDVLRASGWTVGVSSNTNFIRGALLQDIFCLPWDFAVYSDEIGVSKPDADFFEVVVTKALDITGGWRKLIHIGDNSACDVAGSIAAGFNGILTKSTEQTVELMKELV